MRLARDPMVGNLSAHPVLRTFVLFLVVIFGVAALGGPSARAIDVPGPIYEIHGIVTDSSGVNLEGASVTLVRSSTAQPVANGTTDAEGKYVFSMVEAGNYTVSGAHDCCLRASIGVFVGETALQVDADTLALKIKEPVQSDDPVLLSGTVSDQDDEPMVGVVLEVTSYYSGDDDGCSEDGMCVSSVGAQWFTTESDATGAFELEVNRGWASLRSSFFGYDTLYGTIQLPDDRSITVPMRSSDDNTVRLHGALRSTSSEPIADGWISAGPDYGRGSCPPDADCVASYSPGPPQTQNCDDPCWNYESPYNQFNSTSTRGDGSWELIVAAGNLRVQASAPDFLEEQSTVRTEAGQDLEVQFSLEAIPPDSIPVSGRVTEASSDDVVPFAYLNVENQKWGTWASIEADEDGNYELLAKPGYNILTAARYPRYGCAVPDTVPEYASDDQPASMTVVAPHSCEPSDEDSKEYLPTHRSFVAVEGEEYEFDFELTERPQPTSEFKGYVLDAGNGNAIPDAAVTFYNEATHDWGSATTDEDGSYRIEVYAGYYSVRIWADGYFDGVDNLDIDGDEAQRADFDLVAGEKRYGHWSYGGYRVAEASMSGESDGPPMPAEGDEAFHGSEGGLGPYHAEGQDGANAPGFEFLLGTVAAGAVALVRRRT